MTDSIEAAELYAVLGLKRAPSILDARSADARSSGHHVIPGALPLQDISVERFAKSLPKDREVVVYCEHGHERSVAAARSMQTLGFDARILAGGFETWVANKLPTVRLRKGQIAGGSRWITRERPKIDRLACPWLIRRFIDPTAQFFYTAPQRVREEGESLNAVPYDIADVTFSHRGERCSFDAFLEEFDLHDPHIDAVANIVRAADTATLERSPQAPGLLAISLGLSANQPDDVLLLEQAMPIYDALYSWCKTARSERHGWPQASA